MVTVFSKQNCKRLHNLFKSFPFSGKPHQTVKEWIGKDWEWIGNGLGMDWEWIGKGLRLQGW